MAVDTIGQAGLLLVAGVASVILSIEIGSYGGGLLLLGAVELAGAGALETPIRTARQPENEWAGKRFSDTRVTL